MDRPPLDHPYQALQPLPRTVWRGALVTSQGTREGRLAGARRWLAALEAGRLPPTDADLGAPAALAPMRQAVGELGLPALACGVPALAEQVLRTLLFHLDRIAGWQPKCTDSEAVARAAAEFRDEWQRQAAALEERLALLRGLGDLAALRWDDLAGQLSTRDWQAARRAADWLAQLPELNALIQRLGRAERSTQAAARTPQAAPAAGRPAALRAVHTRLPGAPGEVTGVCFSSRPERMLPAEGVMLRHRVLHKLWKARHAEARLLSFDTEAALVDWRADPAARPPAAAPQAEPEALERGPLVLCLDTSGSMRGAPENVAKAAVIAALRSAHASGRGCVLLAFGGPGEVVESELGAGRAGLAALLALMGQGFDGGTDVQTPIERAIERVHEARWRSADLLVVTDGEFGCTPQTLARVEAARAELGLRVQGVLVGDRETLGLLNLCDAIYWVRDWRRYAGAAAGAAAQGHSPVHSRSLTALYFPGALTGRAAAQAAPPPQPSPPK